METILVVDDEIKTQEILKTAFSQEGYQVVTAFNEEEALKRFKESQCSLVITDMRMKKKQGGLELIKEIKTQKNIPIIVITAYGTVESAVEAMKEGAFDYILKPFNLDEIKIVARRALESTRLTREVQSLRKQLKDKYKFDNIIGKSKKMEDIFELIEQIVESRATVLITGESGTGKELISRAIHYRSSRHNKPFIVVHCTALPETLLESELFGYEKGAFTDAYRDKPGYLELAQGGTLFLDEIGDMSPPLQAKLLRVLESLEFIRLGGRETIRVELRFIAATNQDLKEKIKEKTFREDLFYRLNVVPINLPPLRERKEDIPLLVEHFLNKFNLSAVPGKGQASQDKKDKVDSAKELGRAGQSLGIKLSLPALNLILNYDWPGNVRELENTLERCVLLSKGKTITPEDLPEEIRGSHPKIWSDSTLLALPYHQALSSFEKRYLTETLRKTGGNISRAAEMTGVKRQHLQRKVKEYSINCSELRSD